MTMVFRVRDKGWLDTLAVGDRVVFEADKIDGHCVVTGIRKAPLAWRPLPGAVRPASAPTPAL